MSVGQLSRFSALLLLSAAAVLRCALERPAPARLHPGPTHPPTPPYLPPTLQVVADLFDGWHIALYVADFSRTYAAVHHPDRQPWNDHPYR